MKLSNANTLSNDVVLSGKLKLKSRPFGVSKPQRNVRNVHNAHKKVRSERNEMNTRKPPMLKTYLLCL